MKEKVKALGLDIIFIIVGSALLAVSIDVFTAPNNIAPGGVSGISTMMNYLWEAPIGLVAFIINIPILLWGIIEIGYKFLMKTILAVVVSSVLIDVFEGVLPVYKGDMMLTSLLAGVTMGVGLALVFLRGATTGGTDMVARLLGRRFRHISMGKLMLAVDGVIVVASAFVFKSIENAVYACIVIVVSSFLIDKILYGADVGTGKVFYVVSSKTKEIGERIMKEMDRGVTYIDSRGGYSNKSGEMLFCAVRRYEVYTINKIIREVDRDAFVIVGDAGEISGEGFKPTSTDDKPLRELIKKK